jgi:hypothetical protein
LKVAGSSLEGKYLEQSEEFDLFRKKFLVSKVKAAVSNAKFT